jgi:hypothetical protein
LIADWRIPLIHLDITNRYTLHLTGCPQDSQNDITERAFHSPIDHTTDTFFSGLSAPHHGTGPQNVLFVKSDLEISLGQNRYFPHDLSRAR